MKHTDGNRVRRRTRMERQLLLYRIIAAVVSVVVAILWIFVMVQEIRRNLENREPVMEANYSITIQPREEEDPAVYIEAVDPLEAEKIALAQTVWGEGRGDTIPHQEDVVWTVLARYDDGRYGDSIMEVITAPNQFHGYSPDHPVDADIMVLVERVVNRWLDGDPGPGWLRFWGDGKENHFSK